MIEQTEDYSLQVNESKIENGMCYQITNKKTGVVEVETTILPQALKFLEDLQIGLDAIRDMSEDGTKQAKLATVSELNLKPH